MFLWSQSCLYSLYLYLVEWSITIYTKFGTGKKQQLHELGKCSVLSLYKMETQTIYATNVWVIWVINPFFILASLFWLQLCLTHQENTYWVSVRRRMTGLLSCRCCVAACEGYGWVAESYHYDYYTQQEANRKKVNTQKKANRHFVSYVRVIFKGFQIIAFGRVNMSYIL